MPNDACKRVQVRFLHTEICAVDLLTTKSNQPIQIDLNVANF